MPVCVCVHARARLCVRAPVRARACACVWVGGEQVEVVNAFSVCVLLL